MFEKIDISFKLSCAYDFDGNVKSHCSSWLFVGRKSRVAVCLLMVQPSQSVR